MKKILSILLAFAMTFSLVACGGSKQGAKTESTEAVQTETTKSGEEKKYELALVTDIGTIADKTFNQGAWEGLTQYADEKGITHTYYQPSVQSDEEFKKKIDEAIKDGAKLVVCPGNHFANSVAYAQEKYPEVKFIIIDGEPSDGVISSNTMPILYREDQAGFLAGYAAVKDGNRQLGFLGGEAVPAVVRFGFGYLQGIDAAAKELGVNCEVKYNYTGKFEASDEVKALASSWYNSGTEVIFACGGALGNSVMGAAEEKNRAAGAFEAKVIGVDVDQYSESDTVITSAIKRVNNSVYDAVLMYYEGKFPGGKTTIFNVKNDGVGIAMEHNKFTTFSKADYDEVFEKLKTGKYEIMNEIDEIDPSKAELTLTNTKIAFMS